MGINRVSFDLPKVSKMNINFELLKVSKMTNLKTIYICISSHEEARNIEFGRQVNIFERIPLGALPQMVMISLAHNHVTNLFISRYRVATVIKFGQ